MKRHFLFAACMAGLIGSASLILCATGGLPARGKGTVLILHNDRALHGDIEFKSDGYLVRRDAGELWLPASEVKCLCAGWDEALAVLRSQANLADAEERLRLAKWCEQNELYTQAIAETKAALHLRPKHQPTQQYLTCLERAADMATHPPAPPAVKKDSTDLPSLDLSADSLGLFVTKVQPILMNTCAACHAGDQGGQFKLMRVSGIGTSWQRATQVNMNAAVRQINLDNPDASPLLFKSVSRHSAAMQSPPLSGRAAPPYQILRQWIDMTIASNPHLRQVLPASAAAPAKMFTQAAPAANPQQTSAAPGPLPVFGSDVQPLTQNNMPGNAGPAIVSKFSPPGPPVVVPALYTTPAKQSPGQITPVVSNQNPPAAPDAGPEDEFAASIFNKLFHPGKN